MENFDPLLMFETIRAGNDARRRSFDIGQRRVLLGRLDAWIRSHEPDICAALAADLGKSKTEAMISEIAPCLAEIAHTRRHLRRWMGRRRVWPTLFMFGTSVYLQAEPKGVVLVVGAWNYPFHVTIAPMAQAIAAGNGVVVKPSEMAPATSALITRLIAEVFDPDLVFSVEGGVAVSTAILALPFDHIYFTGSPTVGKIVMAAAAKHLTSVTLELGGKSPVVVGPGADVKRAAKWIVWGKTLNAGQICVSPDHVYAHASLLPALTDAIRQEARVMAAGGMTKIINDHHFARLGGLIEDARSKGAVIDALGESRAGDRQMALHLVNGLTNTMALSTEEIFGPILPLIPFDTLDGPIAAINAGPKPLILYGFGTRALEKRLRAETSSGSIAMHAAVIAFAHSNLPFGGIGNSGMGAGHGKAGFDGFSHLKPVLRNRFSPIQMLFPPYGGLVRKLARVLVWGARWG